MLFQLLLRLLRRPWGLNNFAAAGDSLSIYSTSYTQYSRMTLDFLSLLVLSILCLQRKSYGKGKTFFEKFQIFFPSSVECWTCERKKTFQQKGWAPSRPEQHLRGPLGHDEHFQLTLDGNHLTLSLSAEIWARARSFLAAVLYKRTLTILDATPGRGSSEPESERNKQSQQDPLLRSSHK